MADESESERTERYLRMATETASLAQRSTDPDVGQAYMKLAAIWMQLANDLISRRPATEEESTVRP